MAITNVSGRFQQSLVVLILLSSSVAALAAEQQTADDDPAWYKRRATWQDTFLSSREALDTPSGANDGSMAPLYVSPVVRGGEPARRIDIAIRGIDELCLFVEGAPDLTYGAATWADVRLVDRDGQETPLVPSFVSDGDAGRVRHRS